MKKILLAISLALSALTLNSSAFAGSNEPVLGVNSFIIQHRYDTAYLPGTAPPSTGFGHAAMSSLTNPQTTKSVYTSADAAKLQAEAYAYFRKTVGLNFDASIPYVAPPPTPPATVNPLSAFNGLPALYDGSTLVAIAVPLSVGIDNKYRVLFDSDDTAYYKNNGQWIVRNFSWIVQYFASGTIPTGTGLTAAGQKFAPTDIVSYGYTVHLNGKVNKDGVLIANWSQNENREFFTVSTTGPQKQPVNGNGLSEQHVALQYINERTHAVGFGSDNVYNRQPADTNNSRVVQHAILFLANSPAPITISPVLGYATVGAIPIQ